MELSGLNPQDKHGRLTPAPSADRPQMLINTVGVYGLSIDFSIHLLPDESGDLFFFPLLLRYELSKLLSGLAINL